MTAKATSDNGPDLTKGISLGDFNTSQMLRGHVGEEPVLLARIGDEVLAVGAACTHYGGPLDAGLIVGNTVRCPWHHACFSLLTGEALGAPAFEPVACWRVERDGSRVFVREQADAQPALASAPDTQDQNIVIIGGGAAGFACAEMLRRRGYNGKLVMVSEDSDAPVDRPNLSKDFLAGTAPDEWMPLKPDGFYAENNIDLELATKVSALDVTERKLKLADGRRLAFDQLLIATGAEPQTLPIPGADKPHVATLRSFADSRAIVQRAAAARSAVVLGSGFIGLETAAALRERGLDVHVVSRDKRPLEKVLGGELGEFIRSLHESHGVTFHMETSIATIDDEHVTLKNGAELAADLVIIGIGVKPRTALAKDAGLAVDHGIVVDARLETAVPGIYAAGDAARWTNASNQTMRVEHWVVAERQGQVAAENMLGAATPFEETPFFWSAHYDVTVRYAGHTEGWDRIVIDGSIAARDCMASYFKDGKLVAVAAIGRDLAALEKAEQLAHAQ